MILFILQGDFSQFYLNYSFDKIDFRNYMQV